MEPRADDAQQRPPNRIKPVAEQAAKTTTQKQVWDAIAESFDKTRTKPWTHVVEFIQRLAPGSRVLDLMAGNGRHAPALAQARCQAFAVDWSPALVASAAKKAPSAAAVVADAVRLPFVDASFDACIYVAGLHGIPQAQGRHASLVELHRVLRPRATAQITVWSRDAPRFSGLHLAAGAADVEVPWRADGLDEKRTYHLYTEDALRMDLEAVGFHVDRIAPVAFQWGDADNLVAVVQRS